VSRELYEMKIISFHFKHNSTNAFSSSNRWYIRTRNTRHTIAVQLVFTWWWCSWVYSCTIWWSHSDNRSDLSWSYSYFMKLWLAPKLLIIVPTLLSYDSSFIMVWYQLLSKYNSRKKNLGMFVLHITLKKMPPIRKQRRSARVRCRYIVGKG
jgi:hypothetical protein